MAKPQKTDKPITLEEALAGTILEDLNKPDRASALSKAIMDRVAYTTAEALSSRINTIVSKLSKTDEFKELVNKKTLKAVSSVLDNVADEKLLKGLRESIAFAVEEYEFCDLSELLKSKLSKAIGKLKITV